MRAGRVARSAAAALALLGALGVGAPASWGQGAARPRAAGRVVRVFDFEERETNPEPVPRFWSRVFDDSPTSRRRFPSWNKAELSYAPRAGDAAAEAPHDAWSGEGSLRLAVRGGSARAILDPGVVPVFTGTDYAIAARAKGVGLAHARARLTARFLDADLRPLHDSEVSVELDPGAGPHAGDDPARGWRELSVVLIGDEARAAFVQVQLDVLQPPAVAREGPTRFASREEDLRAWAFFDDVAITQLPRLSIRTGSAASLVARPERPSLVMEIRDVTGEELELRTAVVDARGEVVDSRTLPARAGEREEAWEPRLPGLGWYRGTMELVGSGGVVARGAVDFAWVAPPGAVRVSPEDRALFGVELGDAPPGLLADAGELARRSGAGAASLEYWTEGLDGPALLARARALEPALNTLLAQRVDMTVVLARVPGSLRRTGADEPDDAWALLTGDSRAWFPGVEPLVDRFGQRVRRWQVGRLGDDRAFWRSDLADDVRRVAQSLGAGVPGPIIVAPTRLDRAHEAGAPEDAPAFELRSLVPPGLAHDGVREAVGAWASSPGARAGSLRVVFDAGAPGRIGARGRAAELVRRAIGAWAGGLDAPAGNAGQIVPAMSLADPVRAGARAPMAEPELPAWRALVDRLADRRIVQRVPSNPGTTVYLLAPGPHASPDRGGALVAWSHAAAPHAAHYQGYVGDGPVRVLDIFGNERDASDAPAAPGSSRATGIRVALDDEPVFVEGIDVAAVRFLSSLRVEPGLLESTREQHEHAIVLDNPWASPISGTITIVEPSRRSAAADRRDRDWRISPRVGRFGAGPGSSARVPFAVVVGPGADAGGKEFVFEVALEAERSYPSIEVRRTLDVGLKTVRLDLSASRQGEDGRDAVVEATVTNTGSAPADLSLTAMAPGQARAVASITALAPGEQAVRRFSFSGAGGSLRGERVTVSVVDPEAGARLTSAVAVP